MKQNPIRIPAERLFKAKESIRKSIFPSKSYMDYILHYFPSADKKKVYSVWNFRSFDEDAICILEKTAEKLKNKTA